MRRFPSCWTGTLTRLGFKRIRRKNQSSRPAFRSRRSLLEMLETRVMLAGDTESLWTQNLVQSSQYVDPSSPSASGGGAGGLVSSPQAEVLAGDYNVDGIVDTVDYTVWRNNVGQTGLGLAADGDFDLDVDQDDYVIWKQNYGQKSLSYFGVQAPGSGGIGAPAPVNDGFLVNYESQAGYQSAPASASLAGGESVVVWSGSGPGGVVAGVWAQRIGADGGLIGSAMRVDSPSAPGYNPVVASDGDNRFVVAWHDVDGGAQTLIYARRFSFSQSEGIEALDPLTPIAVTTARNYDYYPSVSMASDESFVVSWRGWSGSLNYEVFGRRFAANGAAVNTQFQIYSSTAIDYSDRHSIVADPAGFWAVWRSVTPSSTVTATTNVYRRRFTYSDNNVVPGTATSFIASSTAVYDASLGSDSQGNLLAVWSQSTSDTYTTVKASRYDKASDQWSAPFDLATSQNLGILTNVKGDSHGRFAIVLYQIPRPGVSGGPETFQSGVFLQWYDPAQPAGSQLSTRLIVGTPNVHPDFLSSPAVSIAPNDEVLVAWAEFNQTQTDSEIYARKFVPQAPGLVVSEATDDIDGDLSDGHLSLREALLRAAEWPGADTIRFADSLFADGPVTITLDSALTIADTGHDLAIVGPGADLLTIDGGQALTDFTTNFSVFSVGSGVFSNSRQVTISGMTLTRGATGVATNFGFYGMSSLVLDSLRIVENKWGIQNTGKTTISSTTIANNAYTGVGNDGVGAITISASTIKNNGHGGVYVPDGDVTIVNSAIEGNNTTGLASYGGIYANNSTLTIVGSTIAENHGDGIVLGTGGIASVTNTTISGNEGSGVNAGFAGSATLTNVTVADNFVSSSTVAAGVHAGPSGSITMRNTIVAGNFNSAGQADVAEGYSAPYSGSITAINSLIGLDHTNIIGPGGDNIVGKIATGVIDAKLAPLRNNGGLTRTHALKSGSPALDAADDALAPLVDQRGIARWDNRSIVNSIADIGAFEYAPTLIVTTLDDEPGSGTSGELSLREAIEQASEGEIIGFHPDLDVADGVAAVIQLSALGHLLINKSVDIDATGLADGLTIVAYDTLEDHDQNPETAPRKIYNANGSRLFLIEGGETDVVLRGMKLTGGDAWESGGAIRALGRSLTLEHVEVSHNAAPRVAEYPIIGNTGFIDYDDPENFQPIYGEWTPGAVGGGIFSAGDLVIRDSRFANNAKSDFAAGGVLEGEVYAGDIYSLANLTIERSRFETEVLVSGQVGIPHNEDSLALGGIYATNHRNADADVDISDTVFYRTRGLVVDSARLSDGPVPNSDYSSHNVEYEIRRVRGGSLSVPHPTLGYVTIPGGPTFPITRVAYDRLDEVYFYRPPEVEEDPSEVPGFEIRQVYGDGIVGEWLTVDVTKLEWGDTQSPDIVDAFPGGGDSLTSVVKLFGDGENGLQATLTNVTIIDQGFGGSGPQGGMFLRFRESWLEDPDPDYHRNFPHDLQNLTSTNGGYAFTRATTRFYHADATITGLKVVGGDNTSIYVEGSDLTISDSEFLPSQFEDVFTPPAIHVLASKLTIDNTRFQGLKGDVIEVDPSSDVNIRNSIFFNNQFGNGIIMVRPVFPYSLTDPPSSFGGYMNIENTVFRLNYTFAPRGTALNVHLYQGEVFEEFIEDEEDELQDEPNPHQLGNAVPYRVSIEGSTIEDSYVAYGGGISVTGLGAGLYLEGPIDAYISNSTISNNRLGNGFSDIAYGPGTGTSLGFGGGIAILSAHSLRVENSTISGNYAPAGGGGIFAFNTNVVELINSTITGNTAGSQGGGLFIVGGSTDYNGVGGLINFPGRFQPLDDEVVTMVNTIIAGNKALGAASGFRHHKHPTLPGGFAVRYENTHDLWFAAHSDSMSTFHSLSAESSNNIIGIGVDPTLVNGSGYADPLLPIQTYVGGVLGTINNNIIGKASAPVDPKLTPLGDFGGTNETHGIRLGVGSPALNAGFMIDLIKPTTIDSSSFVGDMQPAYNLISESMTLRETDPIVTGSGSEMDGRQWVSPERPIIGGEPQESPFIERELTFNFAKIEELNKIVLWSGTGGYRPTQVELAFSSDGGKTWGGIITTNVTWGAASGSVLFSSSSLADGSGYVLADAVRFTIKANAGGHLPSGDVVEYRAAISEVRFGARWKYDQRGGPFDRKVGTIDIGAYESPAEYATLPIPQSIEGTPYNLVVSNAADTIDKQVDAGNLSLREAIILSNLHGGVQQVAVPTSVGGGLINLTRGELQIFDGTLVSATGGGRATIDVSPSYRALPSGEGQVGSELPGPVDAYGNPMYRGTLADLGHRNALGSRIIDINDGATTKIDVTLRNLKLTGGFVQGNGGAVRTTEDLTIEGSEIVGNSAHQLYKTWMELLFSAFYEYDNLPNPDPLNTHRKPTRISDMILPSGGGISSIGADLVVNGTLVHNNSTTGSGGGIYVAGGTVIVDDSVIADNVVRRSVTGSSMLLYYPEAGGGIAITRATSARIEDTAIRDNIAVSAEERQLQSDGTYQVLPFDTSQGGGIYVRDSTLDVIRSEISGNEARNGGGLYATESYEGMNVVRLTSVTVSGNHSRIRTISPTTDVYYLYGAGVMAVQGSNLQLRHTTVTENRTHADPGDITDGGGVYFSEGWEGYLDISHSIIANNPGTVVDYSDPVPSSDIYFYGDNTHRTVAYSFIGDNRGSGLAQTWIRDPALTSTLLDDSWEFGGRPVPDANGNIIGGPLIGTHPVYDSTLGYVFHIFGGYADPFLDILADNGGPTRTHAPLIGKPSPVALIQPASVQYAPGLSISNDPEYPLSEIIDDPIAWSVPYLWSYNPSHGIYAQTLPFYQNEESLLIPLNSAPGKSWRTALPEGEGTEGTDYFTVGPNPVLEFNLGQLTALTNFVTWSALTSYGTSQDDEAKELTLEFFEGLTSKGTFQVTRSLPDYTNGGPPPESFALDQVYLADRVVVTITDNYYGTTEPYPWETAGGDRVSIGQVRFIGELVSRFDASSIIDAGSATFNPSNDPDGAGPLTSLPNDQRGTGYSRVLDGNGVGGARIDIGAFETRAMPGAYTAPVLAAINPVTSLVENSNTTGGIKIAGLQVLYGKDLPYIFELGGADAAKFEMRVDSEGRQLRELWLKEGAVLDHEADSLLTVTVKAKDSSASPVFSNVVTLNIAISDANDAPVLADNDLQLAIPRDATPENNQGLKLSDLLSGATDQDGDPLGIAIIGTNAAGHGSLQYTTDNGVTWRNVGVVGIDAALLLTATTNTRLRFNATEAFSGIITDALTFHAWDQSSGIAGTRTAISSLGTAVSAVGDTVAAAISPRVGDPILVNAAIGYTSGDQLSPAVAVDIAGNSVVVWQGPGPNGVGLYARRIDANGNQLGNYFNVVANSTAANTRVTIDTNGNVLVVWTQTVSGQTRVMGAKYTLTGTQLSLTWSKQLTNGVGTTTSADSAPSVAFADDGTFMLAWHGGVTGQSVNAYAQTFTINGDAVGTPELLTPTATAAQSQTIAGPNSVAYSNSHFYVAYVDSDPNEFTDGTLYLQKFAKTGAAVGSDELVAEALDAESVPPGGFLDSRAISSVHVLPSATGEVVIGWMTRSVFWYTLPTDSIEHTFASLYMRRRSDAGTWQSNPTVIDASSYRYSDTDGIILPGSEFLLSFSLAADGFGRVGAAWSVNKGDFQFGPRHLMTKWYDVDDSSLGGPFDQTVPVIGFYVQLAANNGGYFTAAGYYPNSPNGYDIFAQRYQLDSGTPITAEIEPTGLLRIAPDTAAGDGDNRICVSTASYGGTSYVTVNGLLTGALVADVKDIVVDGGAGNDVIDLRQLAPNSFPYANLSITIRGSDGDDEIFGTIGNDVIDAGAGDDKIFGMGGQDAIQGGTGNDTYYINNQAATSVTLADAGGSNDKISFAGTSDIAAWSGPLGTLVVLGYTGQQTISRAASSEVVSLTLVSGNEIETVIASAQGALVYKPSQKPANLVVDATSDALDSNPTNGMTLREALLWAKTDSKKDTIKFSEALASSTIYLANQDADAAGLPDQLVIDSAVTIDGTAAAGLTISGAASLGSGLRSRVMYVAPGVGATLKHLRLTKGSVAGDGGAILAHGDLVLDTVTVIDNQATGANSTGGGVAVIGIGSHPTLQIIDSTITANSAAKGAGVSVDSANATIVGSTIYANSTSTAATEGGGLRQVGESTIDVLNSTISGNKATTGGGIHTSGSGNVLKLTNVTVADNWGDTGGGIYGVTGFGVGPVLMHNSIVVGNTNLAGSTANNIAGTSPIDSSSTYNVIGTGGNGGLTNGAPNHNQIDVAPATIFVMSGGSRPLLAANGGATLTHEIVNSNVVRNSDYATAPPIDQRGYVPSSGDTQRDRGAFEYSGVVDDAPPELGNYTVASIGEDATSGQVVVQIGASPNWRRFTYSIVGGAPAGMFAIDEETGVITIADASLLDADLIPSYLLHVRATQGGGSGGIGGGSGGIGTVAHGTVRVNLGGNHNEAPEADEPTGFSVSSLASVGTLVGYVGAVDPEGDTLKFEKVGGSNAFAVDPQTGAIFVVDPKLLVGNGPFDIQVEVDDQHGHFVPVNVLIDVLPTAEATPPATPDGGSLEYQVSHRKQVSLNPIAAFENYTGRDIRVEYKLGNSTKLVVEYANGKLPRVVSGDGKLDLGTLSLNTDGSLKYKPKSDLAQGNKLKPDGNHRYAASETLSYKIVDANDSSSNLATGQFSIKVTNDLPVYRGDFLHNPTKNYLLDTPITVLRNTEYLVDLSDFFFDPDGDELDIKGFKNLAPKTHTDFAEDNEPGTGTTEIWAVAGSRPNEFLSLPPWLRKVFLSKVGPDTFRIWHDGEISDIPDGYSDVTIGSLLNFDISVTDGQNSGGQPVTFDFQVEVAPNLRVVQSQGELNPLIDFANYEGELISGSAKIVRSQWSVDATARQGSREGRDLQMVGDAAVDLHAGTFVRRQELILDGSGGESEFALPGLIYDSATTDPRPVIQATIKKPKTNYGSGTTHITATFTWTDHVNANSEGPRVLTQTVPYTISSLSTFNNALEFNLAFRPQAPLYTGVYQWDVEVEIAVDNPNAEGGEEVLMLTQHGETPVVVQRKVTTSDFQSGSTPASSDQSPAWWNYTPAFGNGWGLEGVPQLFVDDLFDGPEDDNSYGNDRLILYFPGEAPKVFRPGDGMLGNSSLGRQMYGDGDFLAIELANHLADPREWGKLESRSNGTKIVYTGRDHVQYYFERVDNVANNNDGNQAPGWRIYQIKAPGVAQPVKFQYGAGAGNPIRITQIIGTDGRTTQLNYDGNGFVNQINLYQGDSFIDYSVTVSSNNLTRVVHESGAEDRIREFGYVSSTSRMNSDKWYAGSVSAANLRRATTFGYDSNALLSSVTIGEDAGQTTSYTVTAAAAEGLGATSVTVSPKRTATVTLTTNVQSLGEGTAPGGRAWITNYQFNAQGHVVKQEESYRASTGGATTQLSVERWAYDQFGSVLSHEDKHLRSSSVKDDELVGRMTYFAYDYQTPPAYPGQAYDAASNDDQTPKYDTNDYRGNVTRIDTYAGRTIFEYETDDEKLAALGLLVRSVDPRGVITSYEYNRDGQTTKLIVEREIGDDYVEVWDYFDSADPDYETDLDGLLREHTNALGLKSKYDYYYTSGSTLDSRRLKSVTMTDAGTGDAGDTGEVIFTEYVYDKSASDGYGFVDTVTVREDSSSGAVISMTDFNYDETGLLLQTTVKSPANVDRAHETFEYHPDGLLKSVTKGASGPTTYNYDKRGLLTEVIEAAGQNYISQFLGTSTPIQQVTQFEYYTDGSLKQTTGPDGSQVRQYVDAPNRQQWTETTGVATRAYLNAGVVTLDASIEQVVRQKFDVLGRTLEESNLLTGANAKYEYGDVRHDAPTRVVERVNLGTTSIADGFTITDGIAGNSVPDDAASLMAYDQAGNVIFEQASGQAARMSVYDELGYLKSIKVLALHGAEIEFETDAFGNVTTQTEQRNDAHSEGSEIITIKRFDQQGRLRRIVDTADADNAERTAAIDYAFEDLDPDAVYNFPELPNDRVRTVTTTSREGLSTKQYFDAAGQLVRDVNQLGGNTTHEYDLAGNVTHSRFKPKANDTMTDSTALPSRHTEYFYDKLNRLRRTTFHGTTPYSTYVDYFLPGQVAGNWDVITTDAEGGVTRAMYDSLGNTIAVQQADPGANALGVNDPDDDPVTLYTYSYVASQLAYAVTTRVTTKRGEVNPSALDETRVSRQVFNTRGNLLLSAERVSGLGTSDVVADTADFVDAGFEVRQLSEYGVSGQVSVAADGKGHQTWYAYDSGVTGTGLVTQMRSPNGEWVVYEYDSVGNRLSLRQVRGERDDLFVDDPDDDYDDPIDNLTTWKYDDLGRVVEESALSDIIGPSGGPEGETEFQKRRWAYYGLTTIYADRRSTAEMPSAAGALSDYQTRTVYNSTNLTSTENAKLPGLTYTSTTYLHSDGSVKEISDSWSDTNAADGDRSGDSSSIKYVYDQYGRRVSETEDFEFFNVGPAGSGSKQTSTFSNNGVRKTDAWTFNGTSVLSNTYHVDKLNRVDGVSQDVTAGSTSLWVGAAVAGDKSFAIDYNGTGSRRELLRYGSLNYSGAYASHTSYAYADDGRLSNLTHYRDSGANDLVIASYLSDYDDNGRLVSRETKYYDSGLGLPADAVLLHDVYKFGYDEAGRLVHHTANPDGPPWTSLQPEWSNIGAEAITLDDSGNRVVYSTSYGLRNRMLSDGTYVYEYDNEGNVVERRDIATGEHVVYTWDHRGRMLSAVTRDNGLTELSRVEFHYDAANRRVAEKHTNAGTPAQNYFRGFVYDGDDIVFQTNLSDSGKIIRNFVYGPGVNDLVAIDEGSKTVWNFADQVGTVRSIGYMNGANWEQMHRSFDDFGNLTEFVHYDGNDNPDDVIGDVPSFVDTMPIIFAGHIYNRELGLYDMKARWYDASTGRFLSEDPLGYAAGDLNLYRYGLGDPVNNVDPDGQEAISIVLIILAIAGTYYAHTEFTSAAETLTYESELFHNSTQPDVDRYNSAIDDFNSSITRGAIGASLITAPLGGSVIVAGALGGGAFGTARSYASGADTGQIVTSAAENAAFGAAFGYGFGFVGRGAGHFGGYVGPRLLAAAEPLVARIPTSIRLQASATLLASDIYVNSIGYGLKTAAFGRQAAAVRFAGTSRAATAWAPNLFDDLARQATRNPNSNRVVLGRGPHIDGRSYTKVAAHHNATYFKLENWRAVTSKFSRSDIWSINKAFLNQQIRQGKSIVLSHDPAKAGGYFQLEVEYLEQLGYKFVKDGWVWKAVL
jgi:RHS repeat-associated protein